jgi:hypothetical protein
LADHLQKISHDTINRFLQKKEITTDELWTNVQNLIKIHPDAYLIFDDTVLDKRASQNIELVRKQYSGNEHKVIRGIGLISCIYVNPESGEFWLINYRIYDPDNDGKNKLAHVQEMLLDVVNKKQLPFARVLMDSWYASQKVMLLIDDLGKIYYCPLKKNRLVDDTGGVEKYKQIQALNWTEKDLEKGKLIKIKKFPQSKKVQLFRVTISNDRTEYIATNDLSETSIKSVQAICKFRWKIEEFHREIKQLTGIEKCQCRQAIIQKNHIACSLLVWNFLKKTARKIGHNVYQIKTKWLSDCLAKELENPSLIVQLI